MLLDYIPEHRNTSKVYYCNKHVLRYLVIKHDIPMLLIDYSDKKHPHYGFQDNKKLREALDKMPLRVKVLSLLP